MERRPAFALRAALRTEVRVAVAVAIGYSCRSI
jgi:hypothetical protein